MRSALVSFPSLAAFTALALAGCGSPGPRQPTDPDTEYAEVCVDERTQQRVDDDRCDDDDDDVRYVGGGYHHYYVPHSQPVAAVGQPVAGGTTTRPAGVTVVKAPTVGRGGFGGRGGGGS